MGEKNASLKLSPLVKIHTMNTTISYHQLKTELRQKVTENDTKEATSLLEKHPDIIDARYEQGLTCLMIAATQGNLAMVKLLLSNNAHLDAEDFYQNTAFLKAVENKRLSVVYYLLEQGANPNQQSTNYDNALYLAYRHLERHDFWPFIKKMLEYGVDINLQHYNSQNLLTEATDYDADLELTRFLLDNGADLNWVDQYANTALTNACERGNIAIIDLLWKRGANLNQCTCRYLGPGWSTYGDEDEGFNALMRAVNKNNEIIVRVLIARGTDVNVQSINTTRGRFDGVVFGKTALQIALKKKYYNLVQILIEAGADPDLQDDEGKSAANYLKDGQLPSTANTSPDSNLNSDLMREMAANSDPIEQDEWNKVLAQHQVFLENKPKDGHWQVLDVSGLSLGIYQGKKPEQGTQLELRFTNFTGMSLQNQNLGYANLVGSWGKNIDFKGVNLQNALLVDSYLPNANFEGVILTDADFSRSDLTNANFRNALIKNTDFENCNLTGADFTGAQILGGKFQGAQIEQIKGIL